MSEDDYRASKVCWAANGINQQPKSDRPKDQAEKSCLP